MGLSNYPPGVSAEDIGRWYGDDDEERACCGTCLNYSEDEDGRGRCELFEFEVDDGDDCTSWEKE